MRARGFTTKPAIASTEEQRGPESKSPLVLLPVIVLVLENAHSPCSSEHEHDYEHEQEEKHLAPDDDLRPVCFPMIGPSAKQAKGRPGFPLAMAATLPKSTRLTRLS